MEPETGVLQIYLKPIFDMGIYRTSYLISHTLDSFLPACCSIVADRLLLE